MSDELPWETWNILNSEIGFGHGSRPHKEVTMPEAQARAGYEGAKEAINNLSALAITVSMPGVNINGLTEPYLLEIVEKLKEFIGE